MKVDINTSDNVLPDEQVSNIAKVLEENNPMQNIYEHNDEELQLLKKLMAEIKRQAKDSDDKHRQTMCLTLITILIAALTLIVSICALYLTYKV